VIGDIVDERIVMGHGAGAEDVPADRNVFVAPVRVKASASSRTEQCLSPCAAAW